MVMFLVMTLDTLEIAEDWITWHDYIVVAVVYCVFKGVFCMNESKPL